MDFKLWINSKVFGLFERKDKQCCHCKVKVPVREIKIFGVNGLAPRILRRGNHMCESTHSSYCLETLNKTFKGVGLDYKRLWPVK